MQLLTSKTLLAISKQLEPHLPFRLILFQMAPADRKKASPTSETGHPKENATAFESIPATKIFADFVAHLTYDSIDVSVIENLKRLLLDFIGIAAFAASSIDSSESFYLGVLAFSGGATGNCTVMTKGKRFLPQHSSLLNAAFGHTLDFDDTFAAGALHPGASVISAALAEAEACGADGKRLLTGLAAGYEVICRISRALGPGAYDRGFHNTGTTGIFGAVAAIMKIRGADSAAIESAFGLAGSKAAGSQQFLENGAWNKRLHPGFAAHDAFMCIAFVEQGITTAAKPLEGIFGFLKGYSASPTMNNIVEGLGKNWIHTATAVKPYPGCRMTHGGIDLAAKWRGKVRGPVKSMCLSLSTHCWMVVGRPLPNKRHPETIVDAQFSAYYQLAVAWLDGNQSGWRVYDRIHDKDVSLLLDKITVNASEDLAGLGTRLEVHLEDGTIETDDLAVPLGEPSTPLSYRDVLKKYGSMAIPAYGQQKAEQIMQIVQQLEEHNNTHDLMLALA